MATQNNKGNVITSQPSLRGGTTKQSVSLIPKLRFKEFEDEWKLNNYKIKIISGNTYSLNSYTDKGVFLIQGLNISPGFINREKPIYIDEKNNDYNHIVVKNDDILLGLNRPIVSGELKVAIFNGVKAFLYQRAGILQFESKKINNRFLYQYLRSARFLRKMSLELVGSDQPYIKSNLFDVTKNIFPNLPEQQKIANFLTAVDTKLQQLTTKKETLALYKKGVMQQLFSQQLRFKPDVIANAVKQSQEANSPNETQFPDWEKIQLSDIAERVKTKNRIDNQNVLTISAQLGLVSQLEYFNKSVSAKNLTGYYLLEKGDFAYNKSYSNGYPMGAIKRLNKYDFGVVSTLYICFRFNNNVSLDFMEQYFETGLQNREIEKVAQEGARNHGLLNIGVNDFFDIDMKIPSLKEQQKIANYLSAIDKKIEAVQTQITKTQSFKKGLLQQMFV